MRMRMDYEITLEETEADYKILVDVYCNYNFTAGAFSGKPEDCYPDESEFEIEYFQIRSVEVFKYSGDLIQKLYNQSNIKNFIKEMGFNIKEILENDENLKQAWIQYSGQ